MRLPRFLNRLLSRLPVSPALTEKLQLARAIGVVEHRRGDVLLSREVVKNVKTTVGIDFNHTQAYSTTPLGNGLNYIALSNDALTETSASTTLSNEIVGNGLQRAQGTFAHTPGTTTCTISHLFTCNPGAQSAQKAALFNLAAGGVMHHVLSFTQRNLLPGDTITLSFTITLG
jgi:hypothetical protein